MHELSIAMNILSIAEEECRKAGLHKVEEVQLLVGNLSGVDTEALITCLHIATRDTLLQSARILLDRKDGKGYCSGCEEEFYMADLLTPCPVCFQPPTEFRAGQELQIIAIRAE
jgi:hydrogenase nickel incorporation protein HypA/HybF